MCTYLLFSSSPCILLKVLATRDRRAQGEGVTLRRRTRTGSGGHSCWRVRLLAREYPRVDGHWTSVALHMYTHTHTHTLTFIHTYTHTLTHTHKHMYTHTHTHTHTHTISLSLTHAHTHTHTLIHTHQGFIWAKGLGGKRGGSAGTPLERRAESLCLH